MKEVKAARPSAGLKARKGRARVRVVFSEQDLPLDLGRHLEIGQR